MIALGSRLDDATPDEPSAEAGDPEVRRPLLDLAVDLLPPAVLTALAVHELLYNGSSAPVWVVVLAVVWPLVWRRRAPLLVFAGSLVPAVVLWVAQVDTLADLALLVELFTVAAARGIRRSLPALIALEAGAVVFALRFAPAGSVDDALVLLGGAAAAVFFLGTTVRAQRRHLASVEDRARRLERERQQDAMLAAATERNRIAREMHDIVAHGLSVVITLAEGAAATATTDPGAARSAMQMVASTGRDSLAEMRRLLDVLRTTEDGPSLAPQPDLASMARSIDAVRSTGLDVRVSSTGDPSGLSSTVQATVSRIVQEALTNVLKHGRDVSAVRVTLHSSPAEVRFAVQDDGTGEDSESTRGGNGLAGMRERVALFDGELEAGSNAHGWCVSGVLRLG